MSSTVSSNEISELVSAIADNYPLWLLRAESELSHSLCWLLDLEPQSVATLIRAACSVRERNGDISYSNFCIH